ncbi:MAG: O-antigen ligase family protein [Bacteroidetes bacterium]|nr:O-antigen ligase family protein [Bacteroidota bacterium]
MITSDSISIGRTRLSLRAQILLALGIGVYVVVGQVLMPVGIAIGVGLAIVAALLIQRRSMYLVTAFSVLIIVVKLQEREGPQPGVSILDLLTGGVIAAALGYIVLQGLVNRRPLAHHWSMYFLFGYVAWALVGGVMSIAMDNTTPNFAFREFLLFSPLLVFPILFVPIARSTQRFERLVGALLLFIWVLVQVAGVVRLRSTIAAATFLFETGFSRYDIVNAGLMILLFVGVSALNRIPRYRTLYVLMILGSIGGLVLTFNRTAWVAVVICIPLMLWMLPTRASRREGSRVLTRIVMIILTSAVAAYFMIPMAQLLIKYLFLRIASTSKVGTDLSLVNRYVEWRYVFQQIASNPIMGLGFGGLFKIYNWLLGFSETVGYTHNGILIVIVKGGVVGAICFFTAFIGIFRIGWTARRSPYLNEQEQVLILVCLAGLVFISIVGMTVGLLLHREILLYVGIMWGYLLVINDRIEQRRRVAADRIATKS